MYEGVTLDCGLKIKNGEIITKPDLEATKALIQSTIKRVNSGKQPARIAREKAFEDMKAKRRR